MIGFTFNSEPQFQRIQKAADDATFRSLRSAAFAISRTAKQSIKTSREASLPGEPPTTRGRGGKNIRGSIFTDADRETAVIGPRFSFVGDVGEAHEFGKSRKGDDFPERPFMQPALEENLSRFARDWQGSIGE